MTERPMATVADIAASTKSGRVGVIDEVWTIAPFLGAHAKDDAFQI